MSLILTKLGRAGQNLLTRSWGIGLLVALAYLLVAAVVTYPVILHLGTRLAGDNSSSSDVMESVWGIWWWRHALLDLHQSPLQISSLNYPSGLYFPLYPLMSQTFLLALPLAAWISPVFAYNALLLLSLAACGLAGYALCREISGDPSASFVGGLIWAFFPAKMIHAVAGHLFLILLFSVPLAAWGVVRTLKSPTPRKGVLTALALVVAATIHPTYLVYVLAPTVMVLTVASLKTEGRAFWRRDRVQALVIMAGLSAALVLILLLPALGELQRNPQAVWSSSPDVVGLSPDALGYFVPSADNPLIRSTPLAQVARQVEPYQYAFLIYAGWLPLLLALIGGGTQPAKSRPWLVLAVGGAVFALGPLLKVGGDYARVAIAGEAYRIVMPYALIMNWPFVQWSRTPGRLTVLVMLALSVLATLGLSRLLKNIAKGHYPVVAVAVISALITAEYLVRFPFPSFSASVPASIQALQTVSDGQAAIQVPVNSYQDNQRALYWQTVHQHPLVGGRVYRDELEPAQQYDFYRRLLLDPARPLGADQRLATFASAGIGWVIYDAAADPQGSVRAQLKSLLGQPLAEDSDSALFKLSAQPLAPDSLLWDWGFNWETPSAANPGRRFCQRGEIRLFASNEMAKQLSFGVVPTSALRRITVRLNHQPVGRYVVADAAQFHTPPFTLKRGYNLLEFVDEALAPAVSGTASPAAVCTADGGAPYTWSPVISDPQFAPAQAIDQPPVAAFGSALNLLAFSIPDQARSGSSITVHLVWQAVAPVEDDLTVFVHLLTVNNQMAAQQDLPLLGESYPTSQWKLGEVVATPLTLSLPPDLPAGTYQLGLGLYRQPSLERLAVTGVATDNIVRLGPLTVGP